MSTLKILIPTDFTILPEYALHLVKNLQNKIKTDIHFLHVLEFPDTVTINEKGEIETCGEIELNYVQTRLNIARQKLEHLQQSYGSEINTHLTTGALTSTITAFASENKFDLIVMGTKGALGLAEKLSGSETQMVVRQSATPVLSLHCDRSDFNITNILFVHDFSESIFTIPAAIKILVETYKPKINLLQLSDQKSLHEKILSAMDKFALENNLENVNKHIISATDIEKGVAEFSKSHPVDVICIGTHGRTGIRRLLHPSATESIINHFYKPVITYHLNS